MSCNSIKSYNHFKEIKAKLVKTRRKKRMPLTPIQPLSENLTDVNTHVKGTVISQSHLIPVTGWDKSLKLVAMSHLKSRPNDVKQISESQTQSPKTPVKKVRLVSPDKSYKNGNSFDSSNELDMTQTSVTPTQVPTFLSKSMALSIRNSNRNLEQIPRYPDESFEDDFNMNLSNELDMTQTSIDSFPNDTLPCKDVREIFQEIKETYEDLSITLSDVYHVWNNFDRLFSLE